MLCRHIQNVLSTSFSDIIVINLNIVCRSSNLPTAFSTLPHALFSLSQILNDSFYLINPFEQLLI